MSRKAQLQFVQRLATLLESGISLSESLSILIRMEKSKKILKILQIINENIEKGVSLSKGLVMSNSKFDPTLSSMISHGENAGILPLSLRQAADMMDNSGRLQKKLLASLIYPAVIALATIGMTLFLVMYIFPKILPLLSSMNIELPMLTRAVRKLYELLLHYGIGLSILIIILASLSCYLYRKKSNWRNKIQFSILTIPFLGEIIKKYFIAACCRSMSTLLECGQSLPGILVQNEIGSSYEPYKRAWRLCREEVLKGISLSQSMRSFGSLFPSIVPDMLAIGERSGSLSGMAGNVSRMYEQELEDFIKYLSTILEPMLMIFMGLVVGSVALSIILPIYEITNHLGH